ncbi:hypothetical protein Kpho02_77910 [Kitasatospora phosalacinea]|uniref:Rhs protein n=1 Tax=Kitasatospora phosalacinea TaxID=2065 RepID=A0A9W6QG51_9ACTN|nr:DUF6531 domain-containing protein [Kitasatospora phosalacinea]GLW75494.1 hypothetical protein Kpho02_77910 [Kitasatospora phosalacinea]
MSNQIVRALEHAAQKLGKTLAEDAGKALKGFYRKAGDNMRKVAKNVREVEEKHAKDLKKIMEGHDSRTSRPGRGSGGRGGAGSGRRRMREGVQDPRKTGVRLNSRTTCSDPVDVSSGEVVLGEVDVSLPATLPLVLHRTHVSSYRAGQWFGPSWASTLDQRLELDEDGVVFASEDGMLLSYPRPEPGVPVLPVEGPRWPLLWDAERGRIDITDPVLGQQWAFAALPGETLDFVGATELPLQEIGDRNGNLIEVLYGAGGAPTEVRHSAGYRIGVRTRGNRITGFDLLGPDTPEPASGPAADADSGPVPAAAALAPGAERALRLVEFGFDGNGNLARVVNSSGLAQEFTYDEHHRITTWCDRNQHRYRYLYDRSGRCVQTRGDGGFLDAVFSYDTDRRTTKVTNALGHTTTYLVNELGQTVAETDPLGARSTFVWDRYDRLLSATDPLGRTTELAYDADGNLTHIRRPDGSTQSAAYNDHHQVVASVLPDGTRWAFDYDERGNLLAQTDPTGTTLHYRRDANGHLTAITDAHGSTTAITTDRAGLPIAITDPGGATSCCVRDGFGRPVEITEGPGRATRTTWTVEGRLASRTHPDGTTEHWTYDPEGNLLEHRDTAGRATRYEYTCFDLVRARTDVNGARYEFTYDAELHLTRVTAPDGLTWTYEFDAAGRPVRERDFSGRTLTYTHDAAGQLVARTNGAGQRIDYRHDLLGRPVEQRTDDAVTRFAYDPMGRLLEAANPTTTVRLRYDPAGRLLSESVAGRTTHFGYDLLGRRTTRRTPTGVETAWTYDPLGQPLTMTTAGRTLRLGYDTTGRETHRDLGALRIGHARDINDRVVAQDLTLWNGPAGAPGTRPVRNLVHRSYRLRDDSTPVAITDSHQGELAIAADPAGRPTALTGWGGPESYAYDQAGRALDAHWPSTPSSAATDTAGERHYSGGLLRRAGRASYAYDNQGRVVRQSRRLLSGGEKTWHYTWDAEDRLTHLTTPDGTCWRYLYDPLGRRTAKQRLAPDLTTVVEETLFTWDGPVLVEQTRTTADHEHARTTTWEWDPDTFRPLTVMM